MISFKVVICASIMCHRHLLLVLFSDVALMLDIYIYVLAPTVSPPITEIALTNGKVDATCKLQREIDAAYRGASVLLAMT